jgi:hypothetical protein
VANLAFADEFRDGADGVFDRSVGVVAMLVAQVDPIGSEPFQ